ncbi:MAG: hypothetical protein AAF702_29000 [Chloroflexota bacterium]
MNPNLVRPNLYPFYTLLLAVMIILAAAKASVLTTAVETTVPAQAPVMLEVAETEDGLCG